MARCARTLFVSAILLLLAAFAQAQNDTGFISAVGTKFATRDCNEFVFSGANVWQLVEAQAGIYGGKPSDVMTLFQNAKKSNINVIRFFPFGVLHEFTLQTGPGVYNQKNWDAIDAILQMASESDVKIIMPFADNWTPVNGKVDYMSWANETDPDSFFTSNKVKQLYKNHIKAMTSHLNALTNIAYKDDPTILAWDLINEVRSACNTSAPNASCTPAAAEFIQDWIVDMSEYVKSVDPNHMLTVGEDGFYPVGDKATKFNPGLAFGEKSGQDFVRNHSPDTIDFATTHIWVDNWQTNTSYCKMQNNPSCGADYVSAWIEAHEADATALNKPLVIEEFGNQAQNSTPNATIRDPIFKAVYNPYKTALATGQPNLRGVAFWQWVYSAGLNVSYSDASYAVLTGDATWVDIIAPSFEQTLDFNNAMYAVANCIPGPLKATGLGSARAPGAAALAPEAPAPEANPLAVSNAGRRLMNA